MASETERRATQREALRMLRHPLALYIRSDAARRQRGSEEVAEDLDLPPVARERYVAAVDTVAAGRPLQPEAVRRVLDSLPATWSTPEERRVAELQNSREGREVLARIAKGSQSVY